MHTLYIFSLFASQSFHTSIRAQSEQNKSRGPPGSESHTSGSTRMSSNANAEQQRPQQEPYLLMGFIGLQNRHMLLTWNLNTTVSDDYQSVGHVMDSLTNPISRVCLAASPEEQTQTQMKQGVRSELDHIAQVVAAVSLRQSDEMGIFDLRTGYLTDLYTHEGTLCARYNSRTHTRTHPTSPLVCALQARSRIWR